MKLKNTITLTNQNESNMTKYNYQELTLKLLVIIFNLIPYFLELGLYILPLSTEHRTLEYGAFELIIMVLWTFIWNNIEILKTRMNLFSMFWFVLMYLIFDILSLLDVNMTNYGFTVPFFISVINIIVYSISAVISFILIKLLKSKSK